jgi:predicted dinucleotide-binding enzyme
MKIGVLGTGMVGEAIAGKLVELGHEVMMGSREAKNPKGVAWAERAGARAHAGSFADTAGFGELLFNCTHGGSSVEALRAAGESRIADKILVDVANILPPDKSAPRSLGEEIQHAFPRARVVKTLNTINCELMVKPSLLSGTHTLFMSGNDAEAKKTVEELVRSFGWQDVLDLGDMTTARATESYMPLWLTVWKKLGTLQFNIGVVR